MQTHFLGPVSYEPTLAAMQQLTASRTADTPDELWICEHPATFTQGVAGLPSHLLHTGDIPVVQTNRGGQVTYHGPGQVVAYPLIDLQRAGYFVKEYVFRIEESVIRTLAQWHVTGHRVAGAPGIYVRLDDPFSHALLPQRPQLRESGAPAPDPVHRLPLRQNDRACGFPAIAEWLPATRFRRESTGAALCRNKTGSQP